MWRAEQLSRYPSADTERFIALVNQQAGFFESHTPITVARAPGRLDLMGGIADYSGALVLQLPLAAATFVALQPTAEPTLYVHSLDIAAIGATPDAVLSLDTLVPHNRPLSYAAAHAFLTEDPTRAWMAYVAGVLVVLQRERGVQFTGGMRLLIHSDVPTGKGVSSSAALEVATMQAMAQAYNVPLDGRDLALLCQVVENRVVGAPCGVMDQMTSACGQQDRLLALRCQPAELEPSVALPAELEVWGVDSGIRHAVRGADYGSVRAGAFIGYRIIAEHAGLPVTQQDDGMVAIRDERWGGYLANISPSEWETIYRDNVPSTLDGAAFLARYGGSTDTVTHPDPQRTYAVRQPTAHPIYEHHRVQLFRALLQHPMTDDVLRLLGELMYQSHASYSACGLGSDGTDRLVDLVRAAGPSAGVYGAKITGGGSGGTVAVLARRGARETVEQIAQAYAQATGQCADVLGGSSTGAMQWGSLRLVR